MQTRPHRQCENGRMVLARAAALHAEAVQCSLWERRRCPPPPSSSSARREATHLFARDYSADDGEKVGDPGGVQLERGSGRGRWTHAASSAVCSVHERGWRHYRPRSLLSRSARQAPSTGGVRLSAGAQQHPTRALEPAPRRQPPRCACAPPVQPLGPLPAREGERNQGRPHGVGPAQLSRCGRGARDFLSAVDTVRAGARAC